MTRDCRTCGRPILDGRRTTDRPNGLTWFHCDAHVRKALQVFGPAEREYRVRRLSASMPELQIAGRRGPGRPLMGDAA